MTPNRVPHRLRAARTAIRELGAVAPLALLVVLLPFAGIAVLAAFAAPVHDWLAASGATGVAAFAAAAAILAAVSAVPTHAVSLLAGYVWGTWSGSALALLAVTIAAVLGHRILAPLAGPTVRRALTARPRAAVVRDALLHQGTRQAVLVICLIRLSPAMPFAGTNLLMAATGAPLRPYFWGSFVGLAPRVVAMVVAGDSLAGIDFTRPGDSLGLWVGIVATVLALVVIGRIARVALRRL